MGSFNTKRSCGIPLIHSSIQVIKRKCLVNWYLEHQSAASIKHQPGNTANVTRDNDLH